MIVSTLTFNALLEVLHVSFYLKGLVISVMTDISSDDQTFVSSDSDFITEIFDSVVHMMLN